MRNLWIAATQESWRTNLYPEEEQTVSNRKSSCTIIKINRSSVFSLLLIKIIKLLQTSFMPPTMYCIIWRSSKALNQHFRSLTQFLVYPRGTTGMSIAPVLSLRTTKSQWCHVEARDVKASTLRRCHVTDEKATSLPRHVSSPCTGNDSYLNIKTLKQWSLSPFDFHCCLPCWLLDSCNPFNPSPFLTLGLPHVWTSFRKRPRQKLLRPKRRQRNMGWK